MKTREAQRLLRDFDVDSEAEEYLTNLLTRNKNNVPRDEIRRIIMEWCDGEAPTTKGYAGQLKRSQHEELLDQFEIDPNEKDFLLSMIRSRKISMPKMRSLLQASLDGSQETGAQEFDKEISKSRLDGLRMTGLQSPKPLLIPPVWHILVPKFYRLAKEREELIRTRVAHRETIFANTYREEESGVPQNYSSPRPRYIETPSVTSDASDDQPLQVGPRPPVERRLFPEAQSGRHIIEKKKRSSSTAEIGVQGESNIGLASFKVDVEKQKKKLKKKKTKEEHRQQTEEDQKKVKSSKEQEAKVGRKRTKKEESTEIKLRDQALSMNLANSVCTEEEPSDPVQPPSLEVLLTNLNPSECDGSGGPSRPHGHRRKMRRLSAEELSDPGVIAGGPIFDYASLPAYGRELNENRIQKSSPYFAPQKTKKSNTDSPGSKRPPKGTVSCVPFPPLTDLSFGLIQEELSHNPFQLLIAVTFLVKTSGKLAIPAFREVMQRFPTAASLADPQNTETIRQMIKHLGLSTRRIATIQRYARGWVERPPREGIVYRVRNYQRREMDVRAAVLEQLSWAEEELASPSRISAAIPINTGRLAALDPGADAWEVGHLTQGRYAIDSWRIFCRDELLGRARDWNGKGASPDFQPEWMRVLPADKELRACLRWMWMREGFEWDPITGEKTVLREEMKRAVNEGRVEYDETGGLRILEVL